MARSAAAFLSIKNLIHNYNTIKNIAPRSKIMPMIKANAYGHGLRSVAKSLSNCDNLASFGVASIDEAFALRQVGITHSITLMEGVFEPLEMNILAEQNFDIVIHSEEQLSWFSDLPMNLRGFNIWLKIDTGMGRLGFDHINGLELYRYLYGLKSEHSFVGLMSHMACADEKDKSLNFAQIKIFDNLASNVEGPRSFCNSAAIFNFQDQHYEIVRPGLALYGLSPVCSISAKDLNLKPVMSLWSELISVKTIKAGGYVGYGGLHLCLEDTKVGIVAIGYGDGYPIPVLCNMPVLINGIRCPIIGRISMDMMAIDVTNVDQPQVGTVVELWGENLAVEELVPYTHNISYHIITGMQHRVKFTWVE